MKKVTRIPTYSAQRNPTYQAFLQCLGWFMPQHYIFGSMDADVMKGHLEPL